MLLAIPKISDVKNLTPIFYSQIRRLEGFHFGVNATQRVIARISLLEYFVEQFGVTDDIRR